MAISTRQNYRKISEQPSRFLHVYHLLPSEGLAAQVPIFLIMKTMRRILSAAFLTSAAALCTYAHDFEAGGIYYNITGDSEVAVTFYDDGTSIPHRYSGDVVIPSTVTYGGKQYTVASIGDQAFYQCTELESVLIPNTVTSIGFSAFNYCEMLETVNIPESVEAIGYEAFRECQSLTQIDIPDSVITIGEGAFHYCSKLASVTLPDGITSIEALTFYDCNIAEITIPESVTYIGSRAFEENRLSSIDIPAAVNFIGYMAFRYNPLQSVKVHNATPGNITIESYAFYGIPTTAILYVPKGSKALYAAADQWKDFGEIVEYDDSAIDDITMTADGGLTVRAAGGGIEISGTAGGEAIAVYGIDGAMLYSGTASEGVTLISPALSDNGLYMVKVGSRSVKFKL